MKQVQIGNIYFVLAVLFLSTSSGNDKPNPVAPAAPNAETAQKPSDGATSDAGKDAATTKVVSDLMEAIENSRFFNKIFGSIEKLDLPTDLTGKTGKEIMGYIALLRKQRKAFKRRMSLNIFLSALGTVFTYLFHTNAIFLPMIGFIANTNSTFRLTLDTDWMIYQEQLAAFLWEYMKLRKINPNKLKKNRMLGCRIIKLEYAPKRYTTFPVWRTEKDKPVPIDASIRLGMSMLKTWYYSK